MDPGQKIVIQSPLPELWNSDGPLDACRVKGVGDADIARLLQDGSSFAIADVGLPLQWMSKDVRFAFWNTDVRSRLVAADADGFCVADYPGGYCYVAAVWKCKSTAAVIVLESTTDLGSP